MLTRGGQPSEVARKNENGWVDIQEFVGGAVCRQAILDEVMDGRLDRERCEEGEEVCDVCQRMDDKERWRAIREGVISQSSEEVDDSGVVMDQADDGSSEVSIDQGFEHERVGINVTGIRIQVARARTEVGRGAGSQKEEARRARSMVVR